MKAERVCRLALPDVRTDQGEGSTQRQQNNDGTACQTAQQPAPGRIPKTRTLN
eukprot:CAMPEP_0174384220 /NCGR_PEP_ID=MMETSP0811_2-20130205/125773_1 /TAXON_ID=73025 ORGANISM="Eutreptiella gymnastica-like, Strain CCMP1594" /NCGR_SAMPLE_ID=MMETSP0811_2 /ASSEMBLY_ACC=CAM_ASM_000667 /LENGTH=52 /DNA_ID=CAMNT_0015538105 /DNA_START=1291 /DNA_END=1449 /DNA_ORIENTATION=+